MIRVLSCSPNLDLALLRAAVLKTANCDVVCPVSQTNALQYIATDHYVLLVCYEYSQEAGQQICDAFKHRHSEAKIVVLRKSHRDSACPERDVEGVVHALEGPGALIKAVLA